MQQQQEQQPIPVHGKSLKSMTQRGRDGGGRSRIDQSQTTSTTRTSLSAERGQEIFSLFRLKDVACQLVGYSGLLMALDAFCLSFCLAAHCLSAYSIAMT